ncbi:MAG: transmembrane prediction [Acidobacterium sp.]|nr:DUF4159 domain-containing protein [Acidobacteriota bacterium]PHY09194.1 MAG: transmembrane prediction [Acidobacterium sp.]
MPRVARAFVLALVLAATVLSAQEQWGGYRGWGGRSRFPPRYPTPTSFDGGFNFCRLIYTSDRGEPGGSGWSTDYWDADINFSTRLGELTKTTISRRPDGKPNHLSVRIADPLLFQCPFLNATDVGTAWFTDDEAAILRAYLLKGGFLWVDDFWGPYAWDNWVGQISKVLGPAQFPIRDLGLDHPIRRTLFEFIDLPQIPSISFWRRNDGQTSERFELSAEPHLRGIADEHGRLMVVMTHNTDISDAWEREAEDPQFFFSFSPQGYAVGLDVVLYGMTH